MYGSRSARAVETRRTHFLSNKSRDDDSALSGRQGWIFLVPPFFRIIYLNFLLSSGGSLSVSPPTGTRGQTDEVRPPSPRRRPSHYHSVPSRLSTSPVPPTTTVLTWVHRVLDKEGETTRSKLDTKNFVPYLKSKNFLFCLRLTTLLKPLSWVRWVLNRRVLDELTGQVGLDI